MRLGLLFLLAIITTSQLCAQDTAVCVKTLTEIDGLPQSYVSGLVQDAQGFVWVATRDGLARYDGRKFKVFNHIPSDSSSLAASIISNLYQDSKGLLWILYEAGDIDLLNPVSEKLQHLTQQPVFSRAYNALKANTIITHSFAEDSEGNIWLVGRKGGVYIFNVAKRRLGFYNDSALGLAGNPVVGLAPNHGGILLVTDTAFVQMDANRHISKQMPYTFEKPRMYSSYRFWKDACPIVRSNGEVIMLDENRLIIYQPIGNKFTSIQLPLRQIYLGPNIMQDATGNAFFDFKGIIYKLNTSNQLTVWRQPPAVRNPESQCMLLDKSGMLWVGGNGSGIQLYDRRLTHLNGQLYKDGFITDVLVKYAGADSKALEAGLLKNMDNYLLRWVADKTNGIWISKADRNGFSSNIIHFANGKIDDTPWKLISPADGGLEVTDISAFAYSHSGRLWGIDQFFRLVILNTAHHTAIAQAPIANMSKVNSMVMDGEDVFWISSSNNGLLRYSSNTGQLHPCLLENAPNKSPSQTSVLLQDPTDTGKLWVGTLGSGLFHLTKKTGQTTNYTTANGLPNNTVYALLADTKGRIWGSTNKGIFRLELQTGIFSNYTAKDGLVENEFNRFHFLQLPDGKIAFGGIKGYIIFDPLAIAEDNFDPQVVLTDIQINNQPASFGKPGSLLPQALNSMTELSLSYQSNFLTFEFAALEYNVPEKLQYRYMLENYDRNWINAGNNSVAVYTKLPPGKYIFLVNATNTAGKWGSHIKRLSITIRPPFWKTWWFFVLCWLAVGSALYLLINTRINRLRKQEKEKYQYELQAMELEAKALRAQMNPHFTFNCLNSIKSLINSDKKKEAVKYLNTFSKLIRSQLDNAKKEISLYDELETCKLYVQLEALRFGDKITTSFEVDEQVDIHSVMVPPLILQPFIENAIWHGILPKEDVGHVSIIISKDANAIHCIIDDNGIGRQASQQSKSKTMNTHQSKGMQLITERLNLHSIIYNRGGSLQVIDKTDAQGRPSGTRAIVSFKNEA